jgi:hypothetical protein
MDAWTDGWMDGWMTGAHFVLIVELVCCLVHRLLSTAHKSPTECPPSESLTNFDNQENQQQLIKRK